MNLRDAIQRFYYELTVSQLRKSAGGEGGTVLTQNSMMYLGIIAFKEKCTVSYLAEILNVSKSAVTIKTNELMRQGMITKKQSKEDRRVFYITVGGDVASIIRNHAQWMYRTVDQIEKDFDQGQIDSFCRVLGVFTNAFSNEK